MKAEHCPAPGQRLQAAPGWRHKGSGPPWPRGPGSAAFVVTGTRDKKQALGSDGGLLSWGGVMEAVMKARAGGAQRPHACTLPPLLGKRGPED